MAKGKEKASAKDFTFLSFGAGRYRCPGQNFAFFEINLVLFCLLSQLEIEPVERLPFVLPPINLMNLVGVTKPEKDVDVWICSNIKKC